MKRTTRRPTAARDLHRGWLQLVDAEGPFLAAPALAKAWPHGMGPLDAARRTALTLAAHRLEEQWDDWQADPEGAIEDYRRARDEFIDVVLRQVVGWGDGWLKGDGIVAAAEVSSPNGVVTVRPTGVLRAGDAVGALVWVVDPVASLRDPGVDGWSDSAVVRMELMLRKSELPLGLVTDGRWWALVSVPREGLSSSGVLDSQTWVAETAVRDAVATVLAPEALVASDLPTHLPQVFVDSLLAAEAITDALGAQVRRAVELLVAALDESAAEVRFRGERDPLPDDGDTVYEAVVTVVMRLVFLLFAEERGLLPQSDLYRQAYGMAEQLDELTNRENQSDVESLDRTHLTWHRLLATSTALYAGANFEDIRLPAYGGSLFDPGRFSFLGARTDRGTLAVSVSDLVMLHVLRAVQEPAIPGEGRRRVSFQDIDVEQIGYIYEGLLGYTCRRAEETTLGLLGPDGSEPEMPLETLDDLYEESGSDKATAVAIAAWVKKHQPAAETRSVGTMTKALAAADTVEDAEQALRAVTDDEALRTRLRGWLGIIRRDLRGRPMVVQQGGWMVVETPSRKNAGAHYTPRDLAEEVVLHALEPLVYSPGPYQTPNSDEWRPLSSDALLELKVADIACGSGAFLVAAARYLAGRLVEAWQREGRDGGSTPGQLETKALRAVVAQCLYGADINAMAVEMCKLSLWLVSLDPDLPFSFVDDKVFHGNSLLGLTSVRQLEALHIRPKPVPAQQQTRMEFSGNQLEARFDLTHRVEEAVQLRRRLATEIAEHDPQRSATAKRAQMSELEIVVHDLATIANGVIAAGLAHGGKPGKKLDAAYENLHSAVGQANPGPETQADPSMLLTIIAKGLTPTVETDFAQWKPLHWCLAVPDIMQRGGFDAVVGNPPFISSTDARSALSPEVHDWCAHVIGDGFKGKADIVAFFILRALSLLSPSGSFGLIATNTLAQGDTREVALQAMTKRGFEVVRAYRSRGWPTETAVEVSIAWGGRASLTANAQRWLDGEVVKQISAALEPIGRVSGSPLPLIENRGLCFNGMKVYGKGFSISERQARTWSEADPRASEVLFREVGGEDTTSSSQCAGEGWIIDFESRSMAEAQTYLDPYRHILENVKPSRDQVARKAIRERWWQYGDRRPRLRAAIAPLSEVLAISAVSKHAMFVRLPARQVFNHSLNVVASNSYALQAMLSSSLHQMWVVMYGSGMRNDPRYTPTDVFETFPRAPETPELERIGRVLDEERRAIMLYRELGLTVLYNRVNNPQIEDGDDRDIARMRSIHAELDGVVMDAYGWGEVPLDHGFHTYRQMTRWTVSPAARVEIVDRLLEENHRRAALQADAPAPADEPVDEEDFDV